MINIAICDNSENDISVIENFIIEYMNNKKMKYIISKYMTGEELLESSKIFNVVFLDIEMGEGINGIAAGKKFRNINREAKVIYTTSFCQYFEQAINSVHAFAYLEKPVLRDDFFSQFDEVLSLIEIERTKRQIVSFEVYDITKEGKIETMIKKFDIDEIYYFEYTNRRIRIKSKDGVFYFAEQMKNLINKMREYGFYSCHQIYLINLKYVKKIKGYELYLKNGEELPVSQKKSAEFREKMNLFIQKSI